MSERLSKTPRQVSPDDLRDKMGYGKGGDLAYTISSPLVEVALWKMAKDRGENVLSTTSAEVIDFIRERYFSVNPKDLSYLIGFFLYAMDDPEFNFGISYIRPDWEDWPDGASGTERDYVLIEYPNKSEKFKFFYLKPEVLYKIDEASKFWVEKTPFRYSTRMERRCGRKRRGLNFPKTIKHQIG